MSRKLSLGSGLVVLLAASLGSQQLADDELRVSIAPYRPPGASTLRVQANLVEVPVVVHDGRGQVVHGLTAADFELLDNGKPQVITAFSTRSSPSASAKAEVPGPEQAGSVTAPAPSAGAPSRFVALFFDDIDMDLADLVAAREAGQSFIKEGFGAADRFGVFTSSARVTLEFTQDEARLGEALTGLRPRLRRPDAIGCPPISTYQAYLIVEMKSEDAIELAMVEGAVLQCPSARQGVIRRADQILEVSDQISGTALSELDRTIRLLEQARGERTLVLVSSGFLTSTFRMRRAVDSLLNNAIRSGVVINSIDAKGLVADLPISVALSKRQDLMAYRHSLSSQERHALNDPMAILAEGTGGRLFQNSNDLERGFRELAAAPELSYVLGFSPSDLKPDGRLHNIRVRVTVPGRHAVEARRGYYAPTEAEAAQANRAERFDAAVSTEGTATDLRFEVAAQPDRNEAGENVLRVALRVDVGTLQFQRRDGHHAQKLRFVMAVLDQQGEFLTGAEIALELALKDESLAELTKTGLDARLSLHAPPGEYRLRVVGMEMAKGRMGALTRRVVIP